MEHKKEKEERYHGRRRLLAIEEIDPNEFWRTELIKNDDNAKTSESQFSVSVREWTEYEIKFNIDFKDKLQIS